MAHQHHAARTSGRLPVPSRRAFADNKATAADNFVESLHRSRADEGLS